MKRSAIALALLAALSSPPAAAQSAPPAAPPAEAQAEAARIAALEARIAALEAELRALREALAPSDSDDFEALAADAGGDEALALAAPAEAGAGVGASAANAFNPAITLILDGSFAHYTRDPDDGRNGFSLGESELAFSANIDDRFYGQLSLAAEREDGEDHIHVEEAYVETIALPHGLSARAGRFFSNIGYLNGHHAHTDAFKGRPLAYEAFLGGQYGDDGVQLRWVAPTATFLELGGEVFRGEAFPAAGARRDGLGAHTLFAHAGGAAGRQGEWLAGVSMLKARAAGGEDGFDGDATVYIADATWKWAPQGNFQDGGVTLRGEYLVDDRRGTWTAPEGDGGEATVLPWTGRRRGGYVEGVYRLDRRWDLGYRYDRVWSGQGVPFANPFATRHTLQATWRNSEFSLVRLQFSRDRTEGGDADNGVVLQYQATLGAHGAHKF